MADTGFLRRGRVLPRRKRAYAAVRVGIGVGVGTAVEQTPDERRDREQRHQRDADESRLGFVNIDQRALHETDDHHAGCEGQSTQ